MVRVVGAQLGLDRGEVALNAGAIGLAFADDRRR
jgi:hypothetical protein